MFQLIDSIERYETVEDETTIQAIQLFGKDQEGNLHTTIVRNLVHYCYMAVSEQFTTYQAERLRLELNDHLLLHQHRCKRLNCGNCRQDGNTTYLCFEPCIQDRRSDHFAVEKVDIIRARGFTCYEPTDRPFLRFKLTRSYYMGKELVNFLNERQDPHLPEHLRGVFETCPKATESYARETGTAGFSWFTLEGEPVPKEKEPILNAPLKILVYDIETPTKSRQFPDPSRVEVASISFAILPEKKTYVFMKQGEKTHEVKRHPESKAEIRKYKNEKDLLLDFYEFVMEYDPDLIVGYNSNSFDFPFIIQRMRILKLYEWNRWARTQNRLTSIITQKIFKGKTERHLTIVHCPGRIFLDCYSEVLKDVTIKTTKKTLDRVGEELDLGRKVDLSYKDMYDKFNGTAEDRGLFAYYNEFDVTLTMNLLLKRRMVDNMIACCKRLRVMPREQCTKGLSYTLPKMVESVIYPHYLKETVGDVYQDELDQFVHDAIERERVENEITGITDHPPLEENEGDVFDEEAMEGDEEEREEPPQKKQRLLSSFFGKNESCPSSSSASVYTQQQVDSHTSASSATPAARGRIKGLPRAILACARELMLRMRKYEGGLVQEGVVGDHEGHIFVFDFNSLYPTVMRAYNLCHTTYLPSKQRADELGLVKDRDYIVTPTGAMFVKEHIHLGVIPTLCFNLIQDRKVVKEKAAKETDPAIKGSYDAEEQAIKVATNAMYGQTGMKMSAIGCMEVADSTTGFGRYHITEVIEYLLKKYPFLMKLYGDTDSVFMMIKKELTEEEAAVLNALIGNRELNEEVARELFIEMEKEINERSKLLPYPMKIGRDNYVCRLLLFCKKKYAMITIPKDLGKPLTRKLVMKGVDFSKGDCLPFASMTAKEILKGINEEPHIWTTDYILKYVRERAQMVLMNEVNRKYMVFLKRLSKDITEYTVKLPNKQVAPPVTMMIEELLDDNNANHAFDDDSELKYVREEYGNPHVVAGRQLQRIGYRIQAGDCIEYYYCVTPYENDKKTSAVVAKEIAGNFDLSPLKYFEAFISPLSRLLTLLLENVNPVGLRDLFDPRTYRKVEPGKATRLTTMLGQKRHSRVIGTTTHVIQPKRRKKTETKPLRNQPDIRDMIRKMNEQKEEDNSITPC